jgi:hypothetical protein
MKRQSFSNTLFSIYAIDKMRIVSFSLLLYLSASALLVAIINYTGLPSSYLLEGSDILFIPIIISAANLISAIYSIFKIKKINPPPLMRPSFMRWLLIAIGVFVLFCWFTLFSVSLFSPYLFGSDHPVPEIGVVFSLIIAIILAVILYFASRMNTAAHPNLFRYIALAIAFLAVSVNSVQCLMLIYAVPVQPPTAYPFLSGLLTIAFIPFSLLILIISKGFVAVREESR